MKKIIQLIVVTILLSVTSVMSVNAADEVWGYFAFESSETGRYVDGDVHIRLYDMKEKLLAEKTLEAGNFATLANRDLYNFQYDVDYILEAESLNYKTTRQVVRFEKGTQAQEIGIYMEPIFGTVEIYTPHVNGGPAEKVEFYNEQNELVRVLNLSKDTTKYKRGEISLPANTYTMRVTPNPLIPDEVHPAEKEIVVLPGVTKQVDIYHESNYIKFTMGADANVTNQFGQQVTQNKLPLGQYFVQLYDWQTDEISETFTFESTTLPNAEHQFGYEKDTNIIVDFTGYEISEVKATLTAEDGQIISTTSKGRIEFPNIPIGTYKLQAIVDNVQTFNYDVTLAHHTEQIWAVQYVHSPTTTVTVDILNEKNRDNIISTTEIVIMSDGKKIRAVQNEKNEFVLYNVPVGVHQLTIEGAGLKKLEKEVVIDYGERVQIETMLIEDHPYYQSAHVWPTSPKVAPNKAWTISFAEPLNVQTVNADNVFVTDGNGILQPNIKLSVIDNDQKLVIEPTVQYKENRKYIVHFKDVYSKTGKRLKTSQFVFYVK